MFGNVSKCKVMNFEGWTGEINQEQSRMLVVEMRSVACMLKTLTKVNRRQQ